MSKEDHLLGLYTSQLLAPSYTYFHLKATKTTKHLAFGSGIGII